MTYNGGKNCTWRHLVNQMPPHEVFIEAFFGSGAVTRFKRPARSSYGIEIDPAVVAAATPELTLPAGTFHLLRGDALHLLSSGWLSDEMRAGKKKCLLYLDPPYLWRDEDGAPVRSFQGDLYTHEFGTVDEHSALIRVLKKLPANVSVMLSGYPSKLYARLLKNWRVVQFPSYDRRGKRHTECVWCNFPAPTKLHDYRYVGATHRQRWNLTKRKRRLTRKLASMSVLERFSLFEALRESLEDGANLATAPGAANGVAMSDPDPHAASGVARCTPELAL